MGWFKDLKLRFKMIIGFGLVIALMVGISVFSYSQLSRISTDYIYVLEHPARDEFLIQEFISAARDMRRVVATMSMFAPTNDKARIDSLYQDAMKAFNEGMKALDDIEANLKTDYKIVDELPFALAEVAELRSVYQKYKDEFCDPVADFARAGNHAATIELAGNVAHITDELRVRAADFKAICVETMETDMEEAENAAAFAQTLIIVVAVLAAIIALFIALFIAGYISGKLKAITAFMQKAGQTGDISLSDEDVADMEKNRSKDEIGMLTSGASLFVEHINHISQELVLVADGDLTTELEVLSDKDIMGQALKHTVESLNNMFVDINSAALHVSEKADLVEEGAKQIASTTSNIAEGAQTLAKGSTDQAASVQALSSSMNLIEEKTNTNAEIADRASSLADTVIANAEKGSRQMEEMISAVKDIAEANQSIQSIMNTIDSIASQTNLLSLNAAIEAARAGEHGRGFAVVADEVRILAAQSAEAAQQTSAIIQTSIEKSQLGTRIVDETAESFKEIVAGLNESSQLIKNIATASEEQAVNISQIKLGIDQVSDIVEQNSATAEESAAASEESAASATDSIMAAEELKNQSDVMKELVSRFKLTK